MAKLEINIDREEDTGQFSLDYDSIDDVIDIFFHAGRVLSMQIDEKYKEDSKDVKALLVRYFMYGMINQNLEK